MTSRGLLRLANAGTLGALALGLATACGAAAPAPEGAAPRAQHPASGPATAESLELPTATEPVDILVRGTFRNLLRWAPFLMWQDHGFDINAPISLLCVNADGKQPCAWSYRVASMADAVKSADGVKIQFRGGVVSVDNLCLYVPDGTGGARVACGSAKHGGAPLPLLVYAASSKWVPPSSEDLYFEMDVEKARAPFSAPDQIIEKILTIARRQSDGPSGDAIYRLVEVFAEDTGAFWMDVDGLQARATMAKDGSVDATLELEFGSQTSRWTRRLFDSVIPSAGDWDSFWALPQDAQIAWTTFGDFDWAAYAERLREVYVHTFADEGLAASDARSLADATMTLLGSKRVALGLAPGGRFSWVVGSLSSHRATLAASFQKWARRVSQLSGAASPAPSTPLADAPAGSEQMPLEGRGFLTLIPTGAKSAWWAYSAADRVPFQLREKSTKGYNLGALTELRSAVPTGPIAAFAEIGFPGAPRAALFGVPVRQQGDNGQPAARRRFRAELHGPPRWYDSMITGLIVMFGPGSSREE